MSGSLNIGELTGYLGLNVDDLRANAAAAGRDVDDLAAEVLRAAQEIESQRMRVKLDADASAAERAIREVEHELALIMNQPATARVDGDTREAEERLARLQHELARINGQRVRVRVDADSSGVDDARRRLGQFDAAILHSAANASAIGGAIPAVLALGGALLSLVGIAGTLPALLGAVGAAAATIGVGFSGIGGALTEMGAADTASAGAASAAGAQREAALERVRSAQDSLAQAQEQANRQAITGAQQIADAQDAVADAIKRADQVAIDGARQVESARQAVADAIESAADRAAAAENSLERAHTSAQAAQESLTRAREDATERIEDMALALSGAALDTESAELRLLRAQDRLKKAGTNKNSLNYKEAALGVKQAEQALAETRERYGDVQKEAAKTEAAGVDGADNVVAAQRRLDEANKQVAASQAAVTKAQIQGAKDVERAQQRLAEVESEAAQAQVEAAADVAKAKEALARTEQQVGWARADAAKAVADAERQLAQAIAASGESAGGAAGGVNKLAEAMAKLSPAGRELVQALWALKPAWDALQLDVQQRLLQGVGSEITTLAGTYLPLLNDLLGSTADSFNRAFMDISSLLQTEDAITDVETGIDNVNLATDMWTQGLEPLVQILLDLWAVGSEFLPAMAQGFRDSMTAAAEFVQKARDTGDLREWIQGALDNLGKLWTILTNIGGVIGAIFGAGAEGGQSFLDFLVQATTDLRAFFESAGTQEVLAGIFQFLADAGPTLLALAAAFKVAAIAAGIFNAVAAMNPIGLIVAAVIALAVIIAMNWDAIAAYTTEAWAKVTGAVDAAWQWIKDAAAAAGQFIVDLFLNWTLPGLIIKHWDDIKAGIDAAAQWVLGVLSGFVGDVGTTLAWFGSLPGKFSQWFTSARDAVINKAREILNFLLNLPGEILRVVQNPNLLYQAGVDMVTGLWNGISAMGAWLGSQIMNFVRRYVPGPVLDFLGIASPSKLFRDDVGRWIPEGLADGIIGNAGVAGDAARAMAMETAEAARAEAHNGFLVAESEFARIEQYANSGGRSFGGPDPDGMFGAGPFGEQSMTPRPGATINVYNPAAERASDTLNRKARTLEKLGVL